MLISLSNLSILLHNGRIHISGYFCGHFCYQSKGKSQSNLRLLHFGGRNLRIKPFTVDECHIATVEKCDEWLEELEPEMRFFLISDAADKKDAMLIYCGVDIRRLLVHFHVFSAKYLTGHQYFIHKTGVLLRTRL